MLSTQGHAIAVSHALDAAFSKGKGKILQKFQESLFKEKSVSKDSVDAGKQMMGAFNFKVQKD